MNSLDGRHEPGAHALLAVLSSALCLGAGLIVLREHRAPLLLAAAVVGLVASLARQHGRVTSVYGRLADDNDPALRERT